MLATSAVMGLAVLSKETSIVLVGGLYAFFALTPAVRLHLRHVLLGLIMMAAVITAFPMTVSLSGRASTGGQYLLWQLFRRPNHGPLFYAQVVPPALGWLALGAAGLGLVMLRRESTWRERLLLTWVAVPLAFFCLWPVKGYQYLLPIAPIVAILAGRAIARIATVPALVSHRRQSAALVASLRTRIAHLDDDGIARQHLARFPSCVFGGDLVEEAEQRFADRQSDLVVGEDVEERHG